MNDNTKLEEKIFVRMYMNVSIRMKQFYIGYKKPALIKPLKTALQKNLFENNRSFTAELYNE